MSRFFEGEEKLSVRGKNVLIIHVNCGCYDRSPCFGDRG